MPRYLFSLIRLLTYSESNVHYHTGHIGEGQGEKSGAEIIDSLM